MQSGQEKKNDKKLPQEIQQLLTLHTKISQNPTWQDYLERGQLHFNRNDNELGLNDIEQAVKLYKNTPLAQNDQGKLYEACIPLYIFAGTHYKNKNKIKEAKSWFTKALELAPHNTEALQELSKLELSARAPESKAVDITPPEPTPLQVIKAVRESLLPYTKSDKLKFISMQKTIIEKGGRPQEFTPKEATYEYSNTTQEIIYEIVGYRAGPDVDFGLCTLLNNTTLQTLAQDHFATPLVKKGDRGAVTRFLQVLLDHIFRLAYSLTVENRTQDNTLISAIVTALDKLSSIYTDLLQINTINQLLAQDFPFSADLKQDEWRCLAEIKHLIESIPDHTQLLKTTVRRMEAIKIPTGNAYFTYLSTLQETKQAIEQVLDERSVITEEQKATILSMLNRYYATYQDVSSQQIVLPSRLVLRLLSLTHLDDLDEEIPELFSESLKTWLERGYNEVFMQMQKVCDFAAEHGRDDIFHFLCICTDEIKKAEHSKRKPDQKIINVLKDMLHTYLHYAIYYRRNHFLDFFINQLKMDINHMHFDGYTPLVYAASTGNDKGIQPLLALKADINYKDDIGATALYAAVATNNKPCVDALIEAKADVQGKDNSDILLMTGVKNGHLGILQKLLAAKATVHTKDSGYDVIEFARLNNAHLLPILQAAVQEQKQGATNTAPAPAVASSVVAPSARVTPPAVNTTLKRRRSI